MSPDARLLLRLALAAGLATACAHETDLASEPVGADPHREDPKAAGPSVDDDANAHRGPQVDAIGDEASSVRGEASFVIHGAILQDHVVDVMVSNPRGEELVLHYRAGNVIAADLPYVEGFPIDPVMRDERVRLYLQPGVNYHHVALGTTGPDGFLPEQDVILSAPKANGVAGYRNELHRDAPVDDLEALDVVRACVPREDWAVGGSCPTFDSLVAWDVTELLSFALDEPVSLDMNVAVCADWDAELDPDACCYALSLWDPTTSDDTEGSCGIAEPSPWTYWAGRPFDLRVAGAERAATWARAYDDAPAPDVVAHWVEMAQAEHASVASFARFTFELLALGAPAHLVEQASRAQLDEVHHARFAFDVAARAGGQPVGPGPLDIAGALDRSHDLEAIVVACVREGCVNETIAATLAREAAVACTTPWLADALHRVADDEERHAELAWAFVRWALDAHPELAEPVAAAFRTEVGDPAPRAAAPAWGILAASDEVAIARRVLARVVAPLGRELLASRAA
jgi:hypothetical protein